MGLIWLRYVFVFVWGFICGGAGVLANNISWLNNEAYINRVYPFVKLKLYHRCCHFFFIIS